MMMVKLINVIEASRN